MLPTGLLIILGIVVALIGFIIGWVMREKENTENLTKKCLRRAEEILGKNPYAAREDLEILALFLGTEAAEKAIEVSLEVNVHGRLIARLLQDGEAHFAARNYRVALAFFEKLLEVDHPTGWKPYHKVQATLAFGKAKELSQENPIEAMRYLGAAGEFARKAEYTVPGYEELQTEILVSFHKKYEAYLPSNEETIVHTVCHGPVLPLTPEEEKNYHAEW